MATGIDGKSKQNPRFLYPPLFCSKNELSVRSRTIGPQPPIIPENDMYYYTILISQGERRLY